MQIRHRARRRAVSVNVESHRSDHREDPRRVSCALLLTTPVAAASIACLPKPATWFSTRRGALCPLPRSRQRHRYDRNGRETAVPGRKQSVCFGSSERRSGRSFDVAQWSRFAPKLTFEPSFIYRKLRVSLISLNVDRTIAGMQEAQPRIVMARPFIATKAALGC